MGVGNRPGLQHLTLHVSKSHPHFLLHLSRTGTFLPSPAHDVWTSAIVTSLLCLAPTQSAPLGAVRRTLGHPRPASLLRTFPGTHLTGSQSQVLTTAFVAPVPAAPRDLLTLSAAIFLSLLLHYSTLCCSGYTPGNGRPLVPLLLPRGMCFPLELSPPCLF